MTIYNAGVVLDKSFADAHRIHSCRNNESHKDMRLSACQSNKQDNRMCREWENFKFHHKVHICRGGLWKSPSVLIFCIVGVNCIFEKMLNIRSNHHVGLQQMCGFQYEALVLVRWIQGSSRWRTLARDGWVIPPT